MSAPRQGPVALHRDGRHTEHRGSLFDGEPAEEPELDELTLPWVSLRQPLQRRVKRQDVHVHGIGFRLAVLERHPHVSASFERAMRPRMIDQEPPHGVRGNREEVRPILPFDLTLVNELQVRLVDQRRRRQ
jgi:hypothetical protein